MHESAPIENIRLSFACDRDWSRMLPCPGGRHRAACDKTVVDFTDKNVEELHAVLAEGGKVCGRFYQSQLSRPKPFLLSRVAASLLLALGFSAFSREGQAQTVRCTDPAHDHAKAQAEQAFGMVQEIMPVYKHGGEQAMLDFIQRNLQYPANETINGLVVTTFVIDTTGHVTVPEVVKSLSPGADTEALRVTRLLEFYPGMRAGQKVAVRYALPIRFSADRRKKK